MGKQRPYKLEVEPQPSIYEEVHEMDRETLKQELAAAFKRHLPEKAWDEMAMMAETAEHIAYGSWTALKAKRLPGFDHFGLPNYSKPELKCGCPLASISDWVNTELYHTHPGADVTTFFGYATWDANMSKRFGVPNGIIKVVESNG